MNDPLEDRIRAHHAVPGRQPLPRALEDRLLERRRRQAATPRWVGVVIGIATAAVVFAAIAVPLFERTNRGPSPGTGGTSLGAVRAEFVQLVNTDSSALGKNVTTAQSERIQCRSSRMRPPLGLSWSGVRVSEETLGVLEAFRGEPG
jgi:hypothetical protein